MTKWITTEGVTIITFPCMWVTLTNVKTETYYEEKEN